jgi:hypothetical protein
MSTRRRILLVFGLTLVFLLILAASLSSLDLKPGQPFIIQKIYQQPGISGIPTNTNFWSVILKAFQVLITALAIFYTIYMLIDPKRRKRLLTDLVSFGILLLALSLLRQFLANQPKNNLPAEQIPSGLPGAYPIPAGTPSVYIPNAPDNLVTLIAISLGVLGVAAGAIAWYSIFRFRRSQVTSVELLAAQAEETIEELLAGKNLRETILLCYRRMTEIVAKNRNLPREVSVTSHEFEQSLIARGLPAAPVRDLTHIFEDIRYGDQNAGEEERSRAVSALRIIAAVCRTPESST